MHSLLAVDILVSTRLANSICIALGDMMLIGLLFSCLRIRNPRFRAAAYSACILHSVLALCYVSPASFFNLGFEPGRQAAWPDLLHTLDSYILIAWLSCASALLFLRFQRAAALQRTLQLLACLQDRRSSEHRRLQTVLQHCATRIGIDAPGLLLADLPFNSPFLSGSRRPLLVFPERLVGQLRDNELQAIVMHELMHVTARDLAVSRLLEVIRSLLFFNPAVALLIRRYQAEVESLRDLRAGLYIRKEGKLSMAEGLLKVAEYGRRKDLAATPALAAPFASRSCKTLRKRLRNLQRRRCNRILLALQVAVILFVVPYSPSWCSNAFRIEAAREHVEDEMSTMAVGLSLPCNPISRPAWNLFCESCFGVSIEQLLKRYDRVAGGETEQ